jgi:hypothetical protein
MATQFGSFNSSPLGFYIKSALGARGGRIKGQWFLAQTGANEWVSDDGITWNSQSSYVPTLGFIGARGFSNGAYSDSPYTSGVAFSGFVGSNTALPVSKSGKLWLASNAGEILYSSSNNGATWSDASGVFPATDGSLPFFEIGGNVFKAQSGRLLIPVSYGSGFPSKDYIAYTDDGTNWYLSSELVSSVQNSNLYQQTDGTIYVITNSSTGRFYSTDNGETFSTIEASSNPTGLYRVFVTMPSGRVIHFLPNTASYSYSDDNWTTKTAVGTYNIMFDETGQLYAYRTDTDLIYESSDGSTWSAVATSPSTLVNGSGRPVRVGMYL